MTPQTSHNINERVREIMEIEARAISRAAENLHSEDVTRALELLLNCKGKVVVTVR